MTNYIMKILIQDFEKLGKAERSLKRMTAKQKAFNKLAGGTKLGRINDFNTKIQKTTKNLKAVGGLEGVFKMLKLGFMSATKGVITFTTALMTSPLMPVILLIAAAVGVVVVAFKVLKRMFDLNVGGMKTTWLKFTSKIRLAFAKFRVAFDKALISMGPAIKVIMKIFGVLAKVVGIILYVAFKQLMIPIKILIFQFKLMWGIASRLFQGIMWLLKPVIKLFEPLVTAFKTLIKINPFEAMKSGISWVSDKIKEMSERGGILGFIFKAIASQIKSAKAAIDLLLKPFKWIIKAVKWLMGEDTEKADDKAKASLDSKGGSRNTNNNNNVTINSSGSVDEKSAPRVGNILVGALSEQQRVYGV